MSQAQILIGTSGWMYKDWAKRFYPETVNDRDKLCYFAQHFPTVEVNSTFYHLPSETSVQRWHEVTPPGFVFAVKMYQYLTRTKHLLPDTTFDETLQDFFQRIHHLREKLGIVLVQLPPSMKLDLDRIEHLAKQTKRLEHKFGVAFPLAIEFRHASWFTRETFACLRSHNIAHVVADSPGRWPASKTITGEYVYIRFHGSKRLYRSSYTKHELQTWAEFIRAHLSDAKCVFAYFNNDHSANAVSNALTLAELLQANPKL